MERPKLTFWPSQYLFNEFVLCHNLHSTVGTKEWDQHRLFKAVKMFWTIPSWWTHAFSHVSESTGPTTLSEPRYERRSIRASSRAHAGPSAFSEGLFCPFAVSLSLSGALSGPFSGSVYSNLHASAMHTSEVGPTKRPFKQMSQFTRREIVCEPHCRKAFQTQRLRVRSVPSFSCFCLFDSTKIPELKTNTK